MLRKNQMLAAALVFACGVMNAHAVDLCVTFEGGGGTLVGKGFVLQIPPVGQENTCKPFNGFEDGGLGGGVTGTGCVDSPGGGFILHYSYHNAHPLRANVGSYFESGFCRFKLANSSKQASPGLCRGTVVVSPVNGQGSVSAYHQGADLFTCDRQVPAGVGP